MSRASSKKARSAHSSLTPCDGDDSGKIDADEVEEAFKMLGIHNYDEKEIADAISTYDISGDGEMEKYEFVEFMKDRLLERIKKKLLGQNTGEDDAENLERVPLVSLLDASTQKPWAIPEDGQLDIDFLYDREAFTTNDEAFRQGKISRGGFGALDTTRHHQGCHIQGRARRPLPRDHVRLGNSSHSRPGFPGS
ncbi:unnamed protein product [Phytophthora fragariaefolia]|uniref:Unnamed protein product n=1 Tax=Phytophthora fragariaefolia TaxID=1490495 RepID=A0A9W7CTH6_9STRA|nr:unnamed protein product [Phytophthora fragariaefolia]